MDEFEGDEEPRPEFLCPFCAEDFDIVGLCCHIDEEHTLEAKNGVSLFLSKNKKTLYSLLFAIINGILSISMEYLH